MVSSYLSIKIISAISTVLITHKHHKYKTSIRIYYSRKREIQLHICKGYFQEWLCPKLFFRRAIIGLSGLWSFLVFLYFIISHVHCKKWYLRNHMGRVSRNIIQLCWALCLKHNHLPWKTYWMKHTSLVPCLRIWNHLECSYSVRLYENNQR